MDDDLLAEIRRDLPLRQKIWDDLRRAQKAKRNKRPLDECLALAYDAYARNLERPGKLTLERVDGILPVLRPWIKQAGWPPPILRRAPPTRPIRYRFGLMEAQDSTAAEFRHAAASWTVEVLERLLNDHLAYWRIRVQSREAKEKPKISVFTEPQPPVLEADIISSKLEEKHPAAEELSPDLPIPVPEQAAAAEPPPFPKRAAWLDAILKELGGLSPLDLETKRGQRGIEHRTTQKILDGLGVRDDVLKRLADLLSQMTGRKIDARDIPND
jgi:hypothetical protein